MWYRKYETISIARGNCLDRLATVYGMRRKRYWLIFRESDKRFRERIRNAIR